MSKEGFQHCDLDLAAIVCLHVANKTHRILQAVRAKPLEEADSGWQFLCNSGLEEDLSQAKVFSVREVLELEPTLIDWVDAPGGTRLWRPSVNAQWQVWRNGKRVAE
jgi:hypothetical protein